MSSENSNANLVRAMNNLNRGVGTLWEGVNHIAIVVKDVGKSLQFYTDVVGMKQIMRPNFDRHGAWLTFNNVDLHLIKGIPAVHPDHDLIVSHIAIAVEDMTALRMRLKEMGVKSRRNISVPNPSESGVAVVDQAFVRDPDGYYIEFCNCTGLHEFLEGLEDKGAWNFARADAVLKASKVLAAKAEISRKSLAVFSDNNSPIESSEEDDDHESEVEVDQNKLKNLINRRKIYADVTQTATEAELETLLKKFRNNVPKVIQFLDERKRRQGKFLVVPPAFYERDGSLFQPPPFEIGLENMNKALRVDEHENEVKAM